MGHKFSSLADWLRWQESLHPVAIDLSLSRVKAVYEVLALPNKRLAPVVITVAGTNGKGSSVAFLKSILLAAGYSVGSYTSPHILKYNERICINGSNVSDQEIINAFNAINDAREDISLTYFEFGTLAALYLFSQHKLDAVVLEVGLGGRLDATNIIDADLALITSIGLDHEQWLGETRELIAREKAGIFRAHQLAVCADPNPPAGLLDMAAQMNVNLSCYMRDFSYEVRPDCWHWRDERQSFENLPFPKQRGAIQLQNIAGVIMALSLLYDYLPCSEAALVAGLQEVCLPARFQKIAESPDVIIDVAHNADAFEVLGLNLAELDTLDLHVVIGVLDDKAIDKMLQHIVPYTRYWYLAKPLTSRGMPAVALNDVLKTQSVKNVSIYETVSEAFSAAMAATDVQDRVLVTGSFVTVSEVLAEYYPNSL